MNCNRLHRSLSHLLRLLFKYMREGSATISRRAYYCNALAGESEYNIVINSDMTVSCNCSDFDGSGHIGDLNRQTMEEIFASGKARGFRQQLAAGKLPLISCSTCPELRSVSRRSAREYVHNYRVPNRSLMMENTVACNYRCTGCDRGVMSTRKQVNMSLVNIRSVADTLAAHGVEHLCFFNLRRALLPQGCS